MGRGLEDEADGATIRPTARAFTGTSLLGREGNHASQACVTGNIADLRRLPRSSRA